MRFDLYIKQINLLKYLVILFLNVAFNTYSANTDSLKTLLQIADEDSMKASLLIKLGNEYNKLNADSAIHFYNKTLIYSNNTDLIKIKSEVLFRLARIYYSQSNFDKALDLLYKRLKLWETDGIKKHIASSLNFIGSIYRVQMELDYALNIHKRALKLREEINDSIGIAESLNNIGGVYESKGDWPKVLEIHKRALKIRKKLGLRGLESMSYTSIGAAYKALKDYENALINLEHSIKIHKELGIKHPWTIYELGDINFKLKYYKKAISYGKISLSISENIIKKRDARRLLWLSYKKTGQYSKALQMRENYQLLVDGIYNTKNMKAALEKKTQYAYEKKAAIDSIKHAEQNKIKRAIKKQQDAQINQDRAMRYGLYLGLLLFLIFLVITYNRYKVSKVRAATIIKQNTRIEDSLNYAKKIQQTLLPPISEMSMPFNDMFLFYEPKGIVSGDFYWCKQYAHKTLLVCADCIGHKIMGGLLSTMGGLIIDNVVQKGFNKPSGLLTQISDELIRLLRQDQGGEIQEGMGMSVCIIDHETNKLEFSGARNGVIVVSDNKVLRYSGAFYFIGGEFEKKGIKIDRKFNDQVIEYNKNDWLYMYTDGIIEQLGGKKGGPVGFKRFEQYISELSNVESSESKCAHLKSKLDEWKGKSEQLDDLLVMGFKLT